MNSSLGQVSYWQEFWDILQERTKTPCRHPTFVMYFIGIIVILGGLGFIEAVVTSTLITQSQHIDWSKLVSACYTYFLAIAATAAVDLILSLGQRKSLMMFFLVACLAVVVCGFLAALGTFKGNVVAAVVPSIIGYMLALFLWWVGNATNANLLDTPVRPEASTGGDVQAQPAGDLTGFNS